jgi:hypothetical protein
MAERLDRWIESRGQIVPKSPDEEIAAEGRRLAAPLRALMTHMTPENSDRILQVAETAFKLKPEGFRAFAKELGVTVTGAKPAMKKQLKDLVSGLAVTHVQTQF